MEIFVEKVLERDMDILIMREFMTNQQFANLFLSQLSISKYSITKISHSVMDNELGESDIIVYLLTEGKRIALKIENKINAPQQDRQAERYTARGKKMISQGEIDNFYVFMTAPEIYLKNIKEYEHTISFEQMQTVVSDKFNLTIINRAIQESNGGYIPICHEGVTAFWAEFYNLIDTKFPHLSNTIKRIPTNRGARAVWPGFSTWDKNMRIQYKSNKGYVDLQLNGLGERYLKTLAIIDTLFPKHDFKVVKTGKSLSLRKFVPNVDFKKDFETQRQAVIDGLAVVSHMEDIANKLPIYELFGTL